MVLRLLRIDLLTGRQGPLQLRSKLQPLRLGPVSQRMGLHSQQPGGLLLQKEGESQQTGANSQRHDLARPYIGNKWPKNRAVSQRLDPLPLPLGLAPLQLEPESQPLDRPQPPPEPARLY
jgi:hypothetical protein